MAGLLLQHLVEHVSVVLTLLAVQVNPEPLHCVEDQRHRVDDVGVHDRFEHDPLLQAVVRLVDDAHLLQQGGLARLSGSEQQQVNLI